MDGRQVKSVSALYTMKEINQMKEEIANSKGSYKLKTFNVFKKKGANASASPGIQTYFLPATSRSQSSKKSVIKSPSASVPKITPGVVTQSPKAVANSTFYASETNKDSSCKEIYCSVSSTPALSNAQLKTPARRVILSSAGTGLTPEIKDKSSKEICKRSDKDGSSSVTSTLDKIAETPNKPSSTSKVKPRKLNLSSSSHRTDTRSHRKKAIDLDEKTLHSPVGKTVVKVIEDSSMICNLSTKHGKHSKSPSVSSMDNISSNRDSSKARAREQSRESEASQACDGSSSSKDANPHGPTVEEHSNETLKEAFNLRIKMEEMERKLRNEVGKALEKRNTEIETLKKEVKESQERNGAEVGELNVALEKMKVEKEELEKTLNLERTKFGKLKESFAPLKLQLEKRIQESRSSKAEFEKTNDELKERNKILKNELEETVESLAIDKKNFKDEVKGKDTIIMSREEEIEKLKKKLDSKQEDERAVKAMLTEQNKVVKQQQEVMAMKDKEIERLKSIENSLRGDLSEKEGLFKEKLEEKMTDVKEAKIEVIEMSNKLNAANEKMNLMNSVKKKMLKKKEKEIDLLKKKVKDLESISSSTSSKRKRRKSSSERNSTSTPLKKRKTDSDKRRPSDDVDPVSDDSHSLIIDESRAEVEENFSDISGGSISENCVSIDNSEHSALKEIFANDKNSVDGSPKMSIVSTPMRQLTVEERMSQLFGEETDDSASTEQRKSPTTSGDVPGESLLSESADKTDQQLSQPYSPAKTSRVDHNYSMTLEKGNAVPIKPTLKLKDIQSLLADQTQRYLVPVLTDTQPQDISNEAKDEFLLKQKKAMYDVLKAVTEVVKKCLNKFYQNGSIKDSEEFESFARMWSHKFRDQIKETLLASRDFNVPFEFTIEQEDKKKMIDRILLYFNVKDIVLKLLAKYPAEEKKKLAMVQKFTKDQYDKLENTLESMEMLSTKVPLSLTDDFQLQIKYNILRMIHSNQQFNPYLQK